MIGRGLSSKPEITIEQLLARVQWVNLLWSRKYQQTHKKLGSPQGIRRCCLGVACDPAVTPGIEKYFDGRDLWFDEQKSFLPVKVQDALGVTQGNVIVTVGERRVGVVTLNDQEEWAFESIGGAIWSEYVQPYIEDGVLNQDGSVTESEGEEQ